MATLILTDEFKKILEKQEVITALSNNGYNSVDSFIKEILKRINSFDASLNLRTISYHTLQDTDTYIGVILDEYLNKLYNICVIPPILGTRSGFLSQQIFGFISNLVNGCKISNPLFPVDKPVLIVNCMVDSLADSAICNIIGAKIMGFNYIDIFNRKEDFGSSNLALADFVNTVSKYKDISKDIELADNTLLLKTQRLKDFRTSLTNEPYYFAITAYPAVMLAKKEGYKIDIDDFEDKFVDGKSNKNIKAFITFVKELKTVKISTITSSKYLQYIAALRTKPFLLLAGISGTGKSRIVKQMAFESCPNIDQLRSDKTSPGNYQLIEVKPNWHDSTEVLGYESAITNKYIVTPFVKFLVKAMCHPDVPFFVCMDEMNLAPVEQYFAEFLSVLESRKLVNGTITSEPLIRADVFKNHETQLRVALKNKANDCLLPCGVAPTIYDEQVEYGKFNEVYELLKADGLRIPSNLIVVGTVNMDETTHQFSRKVIDRAMTIEMNIADSEEPFNNFFAGSNKLDYLDTPLPRELFLPTVVQANEALDRLSEEDKEYLVKEIPTLLHRLNSALNGTPFKIAYRVQNELVLYFYELRREEKDVPAEELLARAMDAILMLKVLPRIEGDEELLEKPLEELAKFTANYKQAHAKVEEMQSRLNAHFTSFWP